MFGHGGFNRRDNPLWVIVQDRGQAGQIHVGPAIDLLQGDDFAGQSPTSDQQNAASTGSVQPMFCQHLIARQVGHSGSSSA